MFLLMLLFVTNLICLLVHRKGIKDTKSWVSGIESHLAVDVFFLGISKIFILKLGSVVYDMILHVDLLPLNLSSTSSATKKNVFI